MLTQDFVFAALDAEKNGEQFPIDFDDVWETSGYKRKDYALDFFNSRKYVKNVDFIYQINYKNGNGRPLKKILMTEKCYENWKNLTQNICKRSCNEKEIRDNLAKLNNGVVEIITEVGQIDILTDTEIIEIKNAKYWKQAVGQLLIYSYYYPQHRKRLHLFDLYDNSAKRIIENHCNRFNIHVTWETQYLR